MEENCNIDKRMMLNGQYESCNKLYETWCVIGSANFDLTIPLLYYIPAPVGQFLHGFHTHIIHQIEKRKCLSINRTKIGIDKKRYRRQKLVCSLPTNVYLLLQS